MASINQVAKECWQLFFVNDDHLKE